MVVCKFLVDQNDGNSGKLLGRLAVHGCLLGLSSVYQGFMGTGLNGTAEAHHGVFS